VDDRLQQLHEAHQDIEAALWLEKAHQKEAYKDGKKTAEEFKIYNMVWLNSEDIKVHIPSKKLSNKYLGPFEIIKHIRDLDYKLKLPQDLHQLHNNFHINKLYHWKGNNVNGLLLPPPELLWTLVSPYLFLLSYLDPLPILSPITPIHSPPFTCPHGSFPLSYLSLTTSPLAMCTALCAAQPFFVIPLFSPTHFYCYAQEDYLSFALPHAAFLFLFVSTTHYGL
jgi:hypothetical protein